MNITVSDDKDKIFLKLIDDNWWVEFDTSTPLSRERLRLWKKVLPVFKKFLSDHGYNQLLAGCSTDARVKWANMFGFKKIKESTVDGHVWSIVSMCF